MIVNWCSFLTMFCGTFHRPEPAAQFLPENTGLVKGYVGNTLNVTCDSASALYHQWYQGYVVGTVFIEITNIPLQARVKKTRYIITLEKFDADTRIYCTKEIYNNVYKSRFHLHYLTSVMVLSESQTPIEKRAILTYSQTKNGFFSCENYSNIVQHNVHVGVVDITYNTIIAYNQKSIGTHDNFNIWHSGKTVLCCIYYEVTVVKEETKIFRHVVDKTLLIYDEDKGNTSLDTDFQFNNDSPKVTQNMTCIHRYINGDQQEIVKYTEPIQHEIDRNFIIKVEIFDNNTEIYCQEDNNESTLDIDHFFANVSVEISVLHWSTTSSLRKTILNVNNEFPTKDEEHISLKYNETKNVSFSCQEHTRKTKYVQLGIINTTSNMIETFEKTTMDQTFSITHNGTILCCIYYKTNKQQYSNKEQITRFVTNKSLLVYDNGIENGSQSDFPKGTENLTNSANTNPNDTVSSNQTKIYKIVPAVALTVLILLIVIAIWKIRCRKKPTSDDKVLYATLDHHSRTKSGTSSRPELRRRPTPEEESPYAQIIGEMRPQ